MICKGTTHNNGVRLANYMITGKENEKAELWQLRGFEATGIKDAFRDVQIMAKATKCQQPFLHVQVRNREGEQLTRDQWEHTADRIERMLGLNGQPRAISFHTFENGDSHMHVAWSRIREDDLTAIPLPFFGRRLKKLSRELELEFALEPVTNHRPDNIGFAPTRAEQEQAHRLGLDVHEIRASIRACYERSDCGTSFQAALEHEGFMLAQGDRRDFIVIDRAGGTHALGKRLLDESAAQIRERLSDLDRERLPSVVHAKELVQQFERIPGEAEKIWDRDLADREWQSSVIEASIQKERAETKEQTVKHREAGRGRQEKEQEGWAERPINNDVAAIRLAYRLSESPQEFEKNLYETGFRLARATPRDAAKSHRLATFAREAGRFAPEYRPDEFVAINELGYVFSLNRRSTGESREEVQGFLRTLDDSRIYGIEDTQRQIETTKRAVPGRELWERNGLTSAEEFDRAARGQGQRKGAPEDTKGPSSEIWTAYQRSDNARAFVRALEDRGFIVAVVTREDATNHAIDRFYETKEARQMPAKLREGDFVAIADNGRVYNLNARTTGDSAARLQKFMAPLDRQAFGSADGALEKIQARAQLRDIERQAFRDLMRGGPKREKDMRPKGNRDGIELPGNAGKAVKLLYKADKTSTKAVAMPLDIVSNMLESLFAPILTPEQRLQGELKREQQNDERDRAFDLARLTTDIDREREEAERRQVREREGGARDR